MTSGTAFIRSAIVVAVGTPRTRRPLNSLDVMRWVRQRFPVATIYSYSYCMLVGWLGRSPSPLPHPRSRCGGGRDDYCGMHGRTSWVRLTLIARWHHIAVSCSAAFIRRGYDEIVLHFKFSHSILMRMFSGRRP